MFQKLWKKNTGWDEPLNREKITEWERITQDWGCATIEVARKTTIKDKCAELHAFVDASIHAYATAIYSRNEGKQNSTCSPAFAKTRLSFIKRTAFPENELLAVLIGIQAKLVAKELNLEKAKKFLGSGSRCVLIWIKNTAKQHPRSM